MTKLVIFDLDGTLLNTIADLGAACNYALRTHHFPEHPLRLYPTLVGNGVNKLIERALPEGHKDADTVLRLKTDFIAYYDGHNCISTHPYEGIPEVIQQLRQKGIRTAVASNKYQEATTQLIHHYFGLNQFDIVLGERPSIPRKPDPQIVDDILAQPCMQGILRSEVLYVGDSDVDMQTARNAQLTSVGCTWGFCTREKIEAEEPTFLADNPLDILLFI